jgi:hypothetical protein
MTENDENERQRDVSTLFAEITALLEDAHEIAVRGQNARLAPAARIEAVERLELMLGRMQSLTKTIRRAI